MLRISLLVLLAGLMAVPQWAWSDGRLPATVIRLPESVATVFVAETSTALFHRFDAVGDGIEYSGNRFMSIGQAGAGKARSGDKRTPLGVYFVTEELDTTRLHEKYGTRAFPLDYPNAWDRRFDRSGDGIWVHGVDPRGGKRPPRDTDGCIALPNEDLAELIDQFEDNVTPVVITRELEWAAAGTNSRLRSELEGAIERWASSIASGDMHAFLSLYADDFEHWEMQKPQWSSFSLQTLGKRRIEDVAIDDLLLLSYPEEDELYLSRFRQTLSEGAKKVVSMKRLYWRRDKGGTLRIVAEDNG